MILAAGLGTRLRPYTHYRPKALFSLNGQALIDRLIAQLARSGCTKVVINTHHLAHLIQAHVQQQAYPLAIDVIHEPEILGTGGGIANASSWFNDGPFMVINADVVTDIPLDDVFKFHTDHQDPVTMVLVDYPPINTVCIDPSGRILGFAGADGSACAPTAHKHLWLTFSGIQVLDPEIFDHLPQTGFSDIINAYKALIAGGGSIRAYLARNRHWCDIGTPERYLDTVFTHMASRAFEKACGQMPGAAIVRQRLAGDGSQRRWERLRSGPHTLILGDHGIRSRPGVQEVDAYVDIGRHLHRQGVAVPEIYAADRQAGLVFLEDLGDINLQHIALKKPDIKALETLYRQAIDRLIALAFEGGRDFNLNWAWQTARYDGTVIVENECRYFLNEFINGYLGRSEPVGLYQREFESIAETTLRWQVVGLMHRDMQARNIMLKNGRYPAFIDFQGARIGPVQYDLASLLIDPYTGLDEACQQALFDYARGAYAPHHQATRRHFENGFRLCCLTRNLQILGAFAFLSRRQGKTEFASHIPRALWQLKRSFERLPGRRWQKLEKLVNSL
mgnify:FL=1